MRTRRLFFLLLLSLFFGCDVNFENLGIPDNQASYEAR